MTEASASTISATPAPGEMVKRVGSYLIGEQLGSGTYGTVHRGVAPHGAQVAIKVISKAALGKRAKGFEYLAREISIMRTLAENPHESVVGFRDVLQTAHNVYLVLDLCSGGELFDLIVSRGRLAEHTARGVFRQVVAAVAHSHSLGIAHLDIKPENIFLASPAAPCHVGPDVPRVLLGDFGLSTVVTPGAPPAHLCGTPNYVAPEVLALHAARRADPTAAPGEYDPFAADVWSLGVVLFALCAGRLPFHDPAGVEATFARVRSGSYAMSSRIPPGAAALIRSMLVLPPDARPSVESLLAHPWVADAPLPPPVATSGRGCVSTDPPSIASVAGGCADVSVASVGSSSGAALPPLVAGGGHLTPVSTAPPTPTPPTPSRQTRPPPLVDAALAFSTPSLLPPAVGAAPGTERRRCSEPHLRSHLAIATGAAAAPPGPATTTSARRASEPTPIPPPTPPPATPAPLGSPLPRPTPLPASVPPAVADSAYPNGGAIICPIPAREPPPPTPDAAPSPCPAAATTPSATSTPRGVVAPPPLLVGCGGAMSPRGRSFHSPSSSSVGAAAGGAAGVLPLGLALRGRGTGAAPLVGGGLPPLRPLSGRCGPAPRPRRIRRPPPTALPEGDEAAADE